MTPRHLLLLTGVAMASALLWFGNRGIDAEPAEPVLRAADHAPAATARSAATPARTATLPAGLPILALLDRASVITPGREAAPAERLFTARSWAPPAAAQAAAASGSAPAPVAPALPFSYIGRQMRSAQNGQNGQGGQVEIFLAQGDQVHVVRLHSLLDNSYRVDAISATAISFTYLPLNTTQQLSIGASD
jgi:hypothetical protein